MGIQSKEDRITRIIAHIMLCIATFCAIAPFWLLIAGSVTQEQVAVRNGYTFIPAELSLDAYKYIFTEWAAIGRSYGITILVTVVGTLGSLLIVSMMGYALTRKRIPGVRAVFVVVLITMLFNGGIVPTYYVYSNLLGIKNTIWALIIPNLLVGGFNIILMCNYMRFNIPSELIEAAEIDGCGEYGTFFKIVLPLSKPMLATIGLLTGVGYWNDWTNGLYYITDQNMFSMQHLLNRMNENVAFLANYSGQLAGLEATEVPGNTIRMAIAVVAILPIVIIYPFFQKFFAKGLTMGAVKG